MIIFQENYYGDSISDLDRDISESINPDYNSKASVIPIDEHGFHKGKFIVTVEWIPDSEDE